MAWRRPTLAKANPVLTKTGAKLLWAQLTSGPTEARSRAGARRCRTRTVHFSPLSIYDLPWRTSNWCSPNLEDLIKFYLTDAFREPVSLARVISRVWATELNVLLKQQKIKSNDCVQWLALCYCNYLMDPVFMLNYMLIAQNWPKPSFYQMQLNTVSKFQHDK